MKTLILYGTKHGAACEVAKRIAKKIDGAVLHDLKQSGIPSLAEFDCVIVGSSLYAGMIRKEAKMYLSQNSNALCEKKLGLFLCGMDDSKDKEYFDANFPSEILKTAKAASFMGGIFDPKKAGLIGRLIMKAVAKQSEYMDTINNDKIKKFTEVLKA